MKKLILLLIVVGFVGCNPCKYVAKHQECFQPDTIKLTEKVIHYEKEYIINDSIVRDTVPCDPITNTYYKTNTVYKTKYKNQIDTIYTSKEVSKINPVNAQLKKDNEKNKTRAERRMKIILILVIGLLVLGILLYFK